MSPTVTLEGKSPEVFKESSTKGPHMLGTRWVFPDGRVFHYAKAGAAIAIGRVCGHAARATGLAIDITAAATQARTTAQWDAGTQTVIVATTASASTSLHIYANRYDDGYLWVTDGAGEGQIFQIKSHGVSTSSATTAVTITMHEEELLTVALTTASQFGLLANLYDAVVTHTGTTGGGPAIGVAPRAVTSGYYFWLQTFGPCPVKQGVVLPLAGEGVRIINSTGGDTGLTGTAGSIYPAGSTKLTDNLKTIGYNPQIGFCITPATADADSSLVFLTIAP